MGLSGALSRSEAAVKAFSGKGQTLGSRPENVSLVLCTQIDTHYCRMVDIPLPLLVEPYTSYYPHTCSLCTGDEEIV